VDHLFNFSKYCQHISHRLLVAWAISSSAACHKRRLIVQSRIVSSSSGSMTADGLIMPKRFRALSNRLNDD
jgi:hypothetical protein